MNCGSQFVDKSILSVPKEPPVKNQVLRDLVFDKGTAAGCGFYKIKNIIKKLTMCRRFVHMVLKWGR